MTWHSQNEGHSVNQKRIRRLMRLVREIHERTGPTTVVVTRDQEEAMGLADLVVIMSMGRIEQLGKPAEIPARPASDFVRAFTAA